jgi:XTP/dITP diphosphohydrolase
VCALSLSWPNGRNITVSDKIDGRFSWPPKGNNGFGYDPIFIPIKKKKTFGEMIPLKKYRIDHRYNAFKKLKKFL